MANRFSPSVPVQPNLGWASLLGGLSQGVREGEDLAERRRRMQEEEQDRPLAEATKYAQLRSYGYVPTSPAADQASRDRYLSRVDTGVRAPTSPPGAQRPDTSLRALPGAPAAQAPGSLSRALAAQTEDAYGRPYLPPAGEAGGLQPSGVKGWSVDPTLTREAQAEDLARTQAQIYLDRMAALYPMMTQYQRAANPQREAQAQWYANRPSPAPRTLRDPTTGQVFQWDDQTGNWAPAQVAAPRAASPAGAAPAPSGGTQPLRLPPRAVRARSGTPTAAERASVLERRAEDATRALRAVEAEPSRPNGPRAPPAAGDTAAVYTPRMRAAWQDYQRRLRQAQEEARAARASADSAYGMGPRRTPAQWVAEVMADPKFAGATRARVLDEARRRASAAGTR